MKKLTKQQALEACKKHWQWIADTGGDKWDYPFEGTVPSHGCYACQYNDEHPRKGGDSYHCGSNCIIRWRGGDGSCVSGEYDDWCLASNQKAARAAALSIVKLCDDALARLISNRVKEVKDEK